MLFLGTNILWIIAVAGKGDQSVSKVCVFNNAEFVLQWHLKDADTGWVSADTTPYDLGQEYCLSGSSIGNISSGSTIVPVVSAVAGNAVTGSDTVTFDSASGAQVTYACLGTTFDFSCKPGAVIEEATPTKNHKRVRYLTREDFATRAQVTREEAVTRALVRTLPHELDQSEKNIQHTDEMTRNMDIHLENMNAVLIVGCICLFMLLAAFSWFLVGMRLMRTPAAPSEPLLGESPQEPHQEPAITVRRESVECLSVTCWAVGGWLLACWAVGGWQLALAVGRWLLFVGGLAVGGWLVGRLSVTCWVGVAKV